MAEKETLGEFLKSERETKKISLQDLAVRTRVRKHFLKAIEDDRYELLPSPLYIKGFLSAYAKYIGLDPKDVLLRYERSLKREGISPSEVKPERKRLWKTSWDTKQTLVVLGVIAISLLISYFLHPYLSGPSMESSLHKKEISESLHAIKTPEGPETSPAIEEKPFLLEIKAVEETWVKIQVNGQSQTETLFKSGEGSSYQATDRIELLIGNAGGLDMVFNGRALERFGKSGDVVRLVFTPQGVERKKP